MKEKNRIVSARYRFAGCLFLFLSALTISAPFSFAQSSDADAYEALTADFERLAPQTIHPASGYIRYSYLIPAGYYSRLRGLEPACARYTPVRNRP